MLEVGVKFYLPELGVGTVAGKAVIEAFKHTAGMSPIPRLEIVGATSQRLLHPQRLLGLT
jgi:hypothetical protein